MATRSEIRFATREDGVSFSEHPEKISARFYAHYDGYPEYRGIEIAKSILDSEKIDGWEIDYLDTNRGDLDYVYYIWQALDKTTWISIFKLKPCADQIGECIFVGEPQKLLEKYTTKKNDD